MDANYESCLALLKAHEGGYTDDPKDPGGPTNWGITIADFRHYVMATATAADVRAMTWDQARAVYRPKYWLACRCDQLEGGVDYAVFDYGVNSGVGRVGVVLRRLLGMQDNTSAIDDLVVEAARRRNAKDLADALCAERLAFLRTLSTFGHFGAGWTRRVFDVRAYADKIAQDLPATPSPALAPAPGRGIEPSLHDRVAALQHRLNAAGARPPLAEDGDLGPKTVWAFQKVNGIGARPDGIVGPITKPLLDAALAAAPSTT